jgi:hypothetical protein
MKLQAYALITRRGRDFRLTDTGKAQGLARRTG